MDDGNSVTLDMGRRGNAFLDQEASEKGGPKNFGYCFNA